MPGDSEVAVWADRLARWCRQNSGSGNLLGLRQMADLLAADFGALPGAAVERLPGGDFVDLDGVTHPTGDMLRITAHPDAPRRVLLAGHYDTVFGVDDAFQTATVRPDGTLHGPGAMDMKGGLLVILESLRALETGPQAGELGWEVLISADEEIGSPASRPRWEAAARRAHLGMVFEAALANGGCVRARRGSANFAAIVRGRAAHAGRHFEDGRNAVAAAGELAAAFHALNGQLPAGTIVNVGKIQGGGALNVVPDEARVYLNCRIVRRADLAVLEAALEAEVARVDGQEGFSVAWVKGVARPPREATPELETAIAAWHDTARACGLSAAVGDTGGGSDANLLQAAGLTTLDGLGVQGEGLHSAAEYCDLKTLPDRVRLATTFLHRAARGDFDGNLFPQT